MYASRWYQTEAEDAVFNYFEQGNKGNPVVALPTGTGKSVVIANLVRRAFTAFPNQRWMMLTHVKKLIEQNAEKLTSVWPNAPLGIYSSGLSKREAYAPIVFGGIQSVKKDPLSFGHRDILLVDECHLIPPDGDGMYQDTIKVLKGINPHLKVIGFTATAYRQRQGMITDGGIFTDICYNLTDFQSFNRLVAEGFLAPLITKKTDVEIDLTNVGIQKGEYNSKQSEEAADRITLEALHEAMNWGHNRKCWLVFAAGVSNCGKIADMLNAFGISALAVHSKLPQAKDEQGKTEADRRIDAFKRGEVQCLVNADMLTTGFDHPAIDMIVMLRPTMSPGLWVQMLGRGTRPFIEGGKYNCFVLDFAGNTRRLGPINDPKIPRKPTGGGGDMPIKICETHRLLNGTNGCGFYNHPVVRFCDNCKAEFNFESKLFRTAGTEEVMRGDDSVIEYFNVTKVLYGMHQKKNAEGNPIAPPSMKITYICGLKSFTEYIAFESTNSYAQRNAKDWWNSRDGTKLGCPITTYDALQRSQFLQRPTRIRVKTSDKYPTILGCEY